MTSYNKFSLFGIVWTMCIVYSSVQAQTFISVAAPENPQVTPGSITDSSMWITWQAVPKADFYTVSIKPPTIGANGVGSGILETNTIMSGLAPNQNYEITIRAVQGDYTGNPAVIAQTTALPSPTDVWAVSDSVSQDSMEIAWTEVDGAQSYTVEINPSAGIGGGGRGLYATTTRLRGMSPNTLYTINVYAVNWVGNGAKARLQQFTKLSPPKDLIVVRATVKPTKIGVQWSETLGADSYIIRVTPSNSYNRAIPRIQETKYVIRNLEPDTQYKIEVAASNAAGPSIFSVVNQRTLSMCFSIADSFRDDTFKLKCPPRCSRIQDLVFGTREYTSDSYVCAAAVHDGRVNDNVGGTVVVKKRPGILDFVGTAKNGIISKDYKNFRRSFVFALQSPENVRTQGGSISYDQFTVMWDAVSGAAAYRVTVDPAQGVLGIDSNIEDTRVTLRGLTSNTTYRVYVSAVNRVETSDGTTILQKTALSAPQNIQILSNSIFYDSFTVAWDAMGIGTGVRYHVMIFSNGRKVKADDTVLSSYTAKNLTSGTMYNISIQALNEVGLGQAKWISQYTALQAPVNVMTPTYDHQSMRVQWDRVTGANHYRVNIYPLNKSINVSDPFVIIENLQPDTLYNFSIQAINRVDKSGVTLVQKRTSLPSPHILIDFASLTDKSVFLTWSKLRNASYDVQIFSVDSVDSKNLTTADTFLNLTGLRERTEYVVKVVGFNEIGLGKDDRIAFKTLIMPPANVSVTFDGLQLHHAFLKWDKIPGISTYFLSCTPSDGVKGVGTISGTNIRLSGLRLNHQYKVTLMGVNGEDNGINASRIFSTFLPPPKLVLMHSITNRYLVLQWDPQNFDISTISYNRDGNKRVSVRVEKEDNGQLNFNNLRPNTTYQFSIFSHSLTQYLAKSGVEKPIVTQSVTTAGSESNITDAIAFWPRVVPDESINYSVVTRPGVQNGRKNLPQSSLYMTGFQKEMLYSVSAFSRHIKKNITSRSVTLRFSQSGDIEEEPNSYNGYGEDYNIDEYTYGNKDYVPTPDNNFNGNDNEMDKPSPTEEEPNEMWIPIVIVVVCIVCILLLILIPCLCCCRRRNKPILRNYGCCACCCGHPTPQRKKYSRAG